MTRSLLVLVLAAALALDGAAATTFLVRPDGTGDFPTIRAAVEAVHSGDIVELGDGIFLGAANREIDVLGKIITIRSQNGDPAACVIDCQGAGRGFLFQSGELPQTTLEGVTVTHGWSSVGSAVICADYAMPTLKRCVFAENVSTVWAGGIFCSVTSPTIIECLFINNTADSGGGILIAQGSPLVTHCTFVGNEAYWGGGVFAYGGSTPLVENCTFLDGAGLYYGGAICCSDAGTCPTITNSILAFSTAGTGVHCLQGATASLACCDVFGNAGGDWVGVIAPQYGVNGNICADPLFCGEQNPEKPWTVRDDSPCAPGLTPGCSLIGAWGVGCSWQGVASHLGAAASDGLRIQPSVLCGGRDLPRVVLDLPEGSGAEAASISVHDASGRCVWSGTVDLTSRRRLDTTLDLDPGHAGAWPSGVYLCRVAAGAYIVSRSLVVLR
jgi:hypothetical protein